MAKGPLGPSPHTSRCVCIPATEAGVIDRMKQLKDDYPLHAAALRGDVALMRRLIEQGAHVDLRQAPTPRLTGRFWLGGLVRGTC